MSACTDFLSHPVAEPRHSLLDHLKTVADDAARIYGLADFGNNDLAYYAGLLHDVGKVNPIYQKVFRARSKQEIDKQFENLSRVYVRQHSVFSAWAARDLLEGVLDDYDTIDKIMVLVAGHHGSIRKNILPPRDSDRLNATRLETKYGLDRFRHCLPKEHPLHKLDWGECVEAFDRPIRFNVDLGEVSRSECPVLDYLEMSYAFSCLLQADRGSFSDWEMANFNLRLDTNPLEKSPQGANSPLGAFRSEFQRKVMDEFDPCRNISVINAPTGIGKTKVFLDIMSRFADNPEVERVFYFSPLLALTKDFEDNIRKTSTQLEEILVYNHLHSESLAEKLEEKEYGKGAIRHTAAWDFENESFNKKFTITTTQRLLMTIYSNKASDKLKLASFRNALLVVDEVQTIPKHILSNLKCVFECMSKHMGSKFILVSATIPHEIKDFEKLGPSEDTRDSYLKMTRKNVSFTDRLDPHEVPVGQTLVMANTRRKAVERYKEISQIHSKTADVKYLSSGIRKRERDAIIDDLKRESGYILVSTQVVEAGVDINFSRIFREWAPLDNILQVMGRLNREGQDANAMLTIYATDGKHVPYSRLEFEITHQKIRGAKSSIDLYGVLEEYYAEIYERNASSINYADALNGRMAKMDFEEVWKQVECILSEGGGHDTVLIPDAKDWDSVKGDLLRSKATGMMRKYGTITASLPSRLGPDRMDMFDPDLKQISILMPKKECLDEIYDKALGLDAALQ